MPATPDLVKALESLPLTPGVYLHKDRNGGVLYVGKAKVLRHRVRSYFQESARHTPRIAAMVRQVADVQVFQTASEAEALMLEANLIKKHKPRFNINYKDDKSYPFFKLTVEEPYPRLFLTREKFDKGSEFFGPYASVKDARQTLNTIRRHFKLRTSKMKLDGSRAYRPCLNFQLRKCLAPCRGGLPPAQYRNVVNQVRLFLQGRDKELLGRMEAEMGEHSQQLNFEEAARIRDAMRAVRRTLEKQRVLVPDPKAHQDVFAIARESHFAGVQVLFIRNGRLLGSDFFLFEQTEGMENAEILRGVLNRLYTRPSAVLPKEVLIPEPVEDMQVLADFLSAEKGARVFIHPVIRGAKRKLVAMAQENALRTLKERMANQVDDGVVLEEVQRSLRLRHLPRRVEAFDISNIQGAHTVASMVVWENNKACKDEYRKYKIKTVEGPDDFGSMLEVLTRRYRRVASGEQAAPDLILIDGGKGQVNIAQEVLAGLGLADMERDLIGLAKGRTDQRLGRRRGIGADYEYVVKPQVKNEIRLRANSATLHFLQRIRDESHRFALAYHRTLRGKESLRSELEQLPGVGKTRARALLKHFGSTKQVREASLDEISQVPGMGLKTAREIHEFYHGELPPEETATQEAI